MVFSASHTKLPHKNPSKKFFRQKNLLSYRILSYNYILSIFILIAMNDGYRMTSSSIIPGTPLEILNPETKINSVNYAKKITQYCKKYRRRNQKQHMVCWDSMLSIVKIPRFVLCMANLSFFRFIATIYEKSYKVYCYLNGEMMFENQAEDEKGVCKIITQGVNIARDHPQQHTDDNEKIFQSYLDALRNKAKSVAQKFQDEIRAIQVVKSSNEYIQVYNQIKILILELGELSTTIKARENKVQKKNENLLKDFLAIENEKNKLENIKYEYQLLRIQLAETPSKLDQIIKKQKEVVEKMDFYDEETFNIYLEQTKKLKILENQKKYLM